MKEIEGSVHEQNAHGSTSDDDDANENDIGDGDVREILSSCRKESFDEKREKSEKEIPAKKRRRNNIPLKCIYGYQSCKTFTADGQCQDGDCKWAVCEEHLREDLPMMCYFHENEHGDEFIQKLSEHKSNLHNNYIEEITPHMTLEGDQGKNVTRRLVRAHKLGHKRLEKFLAENGEKKENVEQEKVSSEEIVRNVNHFSSENEHENENVEAVEAKPQQKHTHIHPLRHLHQYLCWVNDERVYAIPILDFVGESGEKRIYFSTLVPYTYESCMEIPEERDILKQIDFKPVCCYTMGYEKGYCSIFVDVRHRLDTEEENVKVPFMIVQRQDGKYFLVRNPNCELLWYRIYGRSDNLCVYELTEGTRIMCCNNWYTFTYEIIKRQ